MLNQGGGAVNRPATSSDGVMQMGPGTMDAIIDHLPILLCVWRHDLRGLHFNRQARQVLGWSEQDAADGDFMAKVFPDLADRQRALKFMASNGTEFRDMKVTARDGSVIDISWSNVTLAPGISLGIGVDIRQRVQAEQALRESEQRFRSMADGVPAPVWMTDDQGQLEFCNKAYHEYFGRDAQACSGERWKELIHPDDLDPYVTAFMEAVNRRAPFHACTRVRNAQGEVRWIESHGRPRLTDSGEYCGFVGVSFDITQNVQTQEQLSHRVAQRTAELRQRAEQLARLTSELTRAEQRERRRLAQVLHDHLQQLLVAARLGLDVLMSRAPSPMQHSVSRVHGLIGEAIDASRSLTIELSPPILHEGGLPAAIDWLARDMHARHGLHVEVHADPDAHTDHEDLKVLLFSAARELLFNVVKHAGVKRACVTLRVDPPGTLCLNVVDHGKGMNPGVQERSGGDGFGLFSLRERLGTLGGVLHIHSDGQGTRVTLQAPFAAAPTPQPEAAPTRPQGEDSGDTRPAREPCGGRARLLLVDDHVVIRQGLVALLSGEPDLQVVGEASDGDEALELAGRLHPDIVLMDFSMPRMNGVEATRRMRGLLPHTRVVALSMFDDADRAEAMKRAGACAYLSKSGRSDALIRTLRELIPSSAAGH
jgi:PAS domain S-box-containing protein